MEYLKPVNQRVDTLRRLPERQNENEHVDPTFSIELFRIHILSQPFFAKFRDSQGNLPLHNAVGRSDPNLMVIRELIRIYPTGKYLSVVS